MKRTDTRVICSSLGGTIQMVNCRIKQFNCVGGTFRHSPKKHGIATAPKNTELPFTRLL
jgi:hypothetical protein